VPVQKKKNSFSATTQADISENAALAPEEVAMLLQPFETKTESCLQKLACQPFRQENFGEDNRFCQFFNCLQKVLSAFALRPIIISCKGIGLCESFYPGGRLAAIFKKEGMAAGLLLNRRFCNGLIAAMLGGNADGALPDAQPYTDMERRLLATVMEKAAAAFAEFDGAVWAFSHLEEKYANVFCANPVYATLQAEIGACQTELAAVVPYSLFALQDKTEKNDREKQQNFLAAAAKNAPLELRAVVKETDCTLAQLEHLQKDSFLPLNMLKNEEISLYCGKKRVLKGIMGKKGRQIAVKITKVITDD